MGRGLLRAGLFKVVQRLTWGRPGLALGDEAMAYFSMGEGSGKEGILSWAGLESLFKEPDDQAHEGDLIRPWETLFSRTW